MHRTLRTLRVLAAAAALVLAGSSVVAAPAQAGQDPAATAGAPKVGSCVDMTLKQAIAESYTGAAVSCSAAHTGLVTAVGSLPSGLDWSSSSTEIKDLVNARCLSAAQKLVGPNVLQHYRSQYTRFWFRPTASQRDAGARWFSCVLAISEDSTLAELPRRLVQLSNHLPDSVARCVTSTYDYTTCADSHTWRSTHAFYVRGTLTKKSLDRAAGAVCPRFVTGRNWLRSAWDISGPRFIVGCYTKTAH